MDIRLKRVYEPPAPGDGFRVLVDRLWPRGLAKADAHLDLWLSSIAPSSALRRWFNHDPNKWDEFRQRYFVELQRNNDELTPIIERVRQGLRITFVYAAKEETCNNAVALRDYIRAVHAS